MAEVARATFLVSAPDRPGLVARLAGFFYGLGLNIVDSSTHSDKWAEGGPRFYMRLVVELDKLGSQQAQEKLGGSATRRSLDAAFAQLCQELAATYSVGFSDQVPRVALLVTKEASCLYDLLLRQRTGELPCEIPLILSNRTDLEAVAESFRVPFFSLPVTPDTKPQQEAQLLALIKKHHIDLLVLARYMQVVSESFINEAPIAINIHHGFLPAFQGARPYHQAHERGVKIIGATAHYVTKDLDQGPILEQDVARVTHELGPEELVRDGRDVERVVLARAVRAHLERRVIVQGLRTIVL